MRLLDSPAFLLISTGSLLGLTFGFGKAGAQAGVSPVVWAFIVSAVPALVLLVASLLKKNRVGLNFRNTPYYLIAGLVSLFIPNLLTFMVIPELGSGFTGLLFTLSPVFTLVIASIWHVRVPNRLGIIGIVFGFVGAVMVTATRGELGSPASIGWTLAGIGIPLSLALGNIYRTTAWPSGAEPLELSIGVNAASASMLLLIILFSDALELPGGIESIPVLALVTVIAATAMVFLHFRLQYHGGPTYLSQISYVAAAVALAVATVVFNEVYSWVTWAGAGIIVIGIGLGVIAQRSAI